MKKLPQSEGRELEVLRQLLVGPELIKLDQLSKRLENPDEFSSDVGEVLPEALTKSASQGEELSQAMVPTVEEIVRLSVKRDINKFADALFPVIGPAIRKSITEAIREMLQSMNQVVENSLSWQGIKWRLESIRTGVPFSQIVLLNSLIYEVQQVFLIHQTTGLLLNHVEREGSVSQSPDMVSSMLTAIGDFVSDSFQSDQGQSLDMIEVGEMSIWLERSPTVILALAIRGNAPESLRTTMQETLEQVELLYSDALANFNGDVSVFESMDGVLYECLRSQYRSTNQKISAKFWLSCLVLLVLMLYWTGAAVYRSMLQDEYLAILDSEPGYVITRVETASGVMTISGLRDPLSRAPEELLLMTQLDAETVEYRLRPYQSLDQSIMLRRLQTALSPPPNVALSIDSEELTVSGFSSEDWAESINQELLLTIGLSRINEKLAHHVDLEPLAIPETVNINFDIDSGHLNVSGYATRVWRDMADVEALKIPGILSYDNSGLIEIIDIAVFQAPDTADLQLDQNSLSVSGEASYQWIVSLKEKLVEYPQIELDANKLEITEQLQLQADIQKLQDREIFFEAATSFNFEANESLDEAAALAKKIITNAKILEKSPKIIVQGYSDSVGSFEDNVFLSLERADYVSQYLFNTGISSIYVVVEGLKKEVDQESSEEERRYNRRVEFKVEIN